MSNDVLATPPVQGREDPAVGPRTTPVLNQRGLEIGRHCSVCGANFLVKGHCEERPGSATDPEVVVSPTKANV